MSAFLAALSQQADAWGVILLVAIALAAWAGLVSYLLSRAIGAYRYGQIRRELAAEHRQMEARLRDQRARLLHVVTADARRRRELDAVVLAGSERR